MINTIVFDFGGVLIDWNPRHFYKNVFSNDQEMEHFLTEVCSEAWNLQQDKGRPFAEGIALLKEKHPEHAENIALFYSSWEQMLNGEIAGTVDILRRLKSKYKIYGLTNWSSETFPVALEKFEFLKLFDGIVVSGIEKIIKPEKKLFQVLLDRYDLHSADCLFIDDNILNIKAAIDLGFHAIHFTSPEKLKTDLQALKVVID
ncbi:HAD family hydrolase [Chitinophaga arvensicola]|uniref:2-haloacid dehalogenase n=1 Tax=Chitinophaga arvensicola TaxID=29529 RepID=A0A1I0RVT9_9BACT|nr:HAD family phosphatase [Chitinophaga arvensicola]SEW45545.1 2-haloacid dehalogenase [Chitinophaga arvensicola]